MNIMKSMAFVSTALTVLHIVILLNVRQTYLVNL